MLGSQSLFIEPQPCGRITAISRPGQRKPMALVLGIGAEIAASQIPLARARQDPQRSPASQGALRSKIAELRRVMVQAEREANKRSTAAAALQAETATPQVGSPRLGESKRQRSQRSVALPRRYLTSRMIDVRVALPFATRN
jgi:hypothetical protein